MYTYIDFEFNRSAEKHPHLLCCSMADDTSPLTHEIWLMDDPAAYIKLADMLCDRRDNGFVFVAYASAAEARCFEALGLDPRSFRWVDLYAEWRQLTYNNESCEYGTYYTPQGFKRKSVPPHFQPERNKGRDNNKVGYSMAAAVACLYGDQIDTKIKKKMRDLILEDKPLYTSDEQKNIMTYCTSDIRYLPKLLHTMTSKLQKLTGYTPDEIGRIQLRRGDYIASVAKMETVGIPIMPDKIQNLRDNFSTAQDALITTLNTEYPFYIRKKDSVKDLRGRWVKSYTQFEAFIKSKNLYAKWPRTVNADTKQYTNTLSTAEKTLKQYAGIPEISSLLDTSKQITQLAWFNLSAKSGDFFDSVGPDDRLRTFLGAFGTQTGRNAPKAKRYIFAMSSWLRCLIRPPKGSVILAVDWASQEFAIAAVLSSDPEMIRAYESGDPYLYFAKRSGAVPEDAQAEWCKKPEKAPPEKQETYIKYKTLRGLFKATTLGLQYGMGVDSLALKLTVDMGRIVTVVEADKLRKLHTRLYNVYWRWLEKMKNAYKRGVGVYSLHDGWSLLPDNHNPLSVGNMPTQGTGAVIMREAVKRCHDDHLELITPLHDALYSICPTAEGTDTLARQCGHMSGAVTAVLGDTLDIRMDTEIHTHDRPWVEVKGYRYYQLLEQYLHPHVTVDKLDLLRQTIYS